jgi:DNA-binding response OmpR family regulator
VNPLSGCRILLIEDEAMVCMLLEDMLTTLGCEVVGPAAGLREALSLARTTQFDAAVLDVNLNGEKSYPVADLLMERGVPFLFSTGYDSLQSGYDGLPRLQKPFKQKDLATSLANVLQRNC